jgi:hypothetical protein
MNESRTAGPVTIAAAVVMSLLVIGLLAAGFFVGEHPNRALDAPIDTHDVATVRRLIEASGDDGHVGRFEVQRAAMALTPSDPRSVEIFRLILEQPTAPPAAATGGAPPGLANMTLTARDGGGDVAGDTSPAEIAARRWSADGLRVLLDLGLDVKWRRRAPSCTPRRTAASRASPCCSTRESTRTAAIATATPRSPWHAASATAPWPNC